MYTVLEIPHEIFTWKYGWNQDWHLSWKFTVCGIQDVIETVIANWKVWIPFQLVNFGFVPPQLQVLTLDTSIPVFDLWVHLRVDYATNFIGLKIYVTNMILLCKWDNRLLQLEFWGWCGASLFLTRGTRRGCKTEVEYAKCCNISMKSSPDSGNHRTPACCLSLPYLAVGAKQRQLSSS